MQLFKDRFYEITKTQYIKYMTDQSKTEYDSFRVGSNVFVVRDNKLLLGKRKNVFGEGTWALPGGHLETGESMRGAAKHELQEETGLSAQNMKFICLVNNIQVNGQFIQVGFLAEGVEGEPELNEPDKCYGWQWFEIGKLPENIFIGHDKLIEVFIKGNQTFADSND